MRFAPSLIQSASGLPCSGPSSEQGSMPATISSPQPNSFCQPSPTQIVGDRRKAVGDGAPDVAAAVAVEIDRILQKARRQELRLSERPRPGTRHPIGSDVAGLQDLQARQGFPAGRSASGSP